jgi:hypothetical protein
VTKCIPSGENLRVYTTTKRDFIGDAALVGARRLPYTARSRPRGGGYCTMPGTRAITAQACLALMEPGRARLVGQQGDNHPMADTYRLPSTPQSIGRVIDAGTQLFKATFSRLVGLALIAQAVIFAPQMVVTMLGKPMEFGSATALIVVLFVGAIIAFTGPYLGVLVRAWRISKGEDLSIVDATFAGYRIAPRWFAASIMYALAIMVGTILLVIPGIYLSIALLLYSVLFVTENCGARASLSRSRELVRGHWWRSLTVISVPLVLVMVVMIVVQVVPFFVFGIDFSNGELKASPALELTVGAVSALLNGLLMPWTITVGIALYNDLRLRRDGDDLSQRLSGLSATG